MLAAVAGGKHEDFRRIQSPLEGKLVRLRAVEETDLPLLNQGVWNPQVTQFLSMAWPEPIAGTRRWWEAGRASPHHAAFVIETLAGELVGVCSLEGITARNRSAEAGIWVGQPHWGKGYGTDAMRTLCRFGFQEMNLKRVQLSVYETNPRAMRSYLKVGFKEEGRLRGAQFVDGRYVDAIVMGLFADELVEVP
jgi:RimJ/RimL family protein N-acetyltransferase